jgi:hypothetical protein
LIKKKARLFLKKKKEREFKKLSAFLASFGKQKRHSKLSKHNKKVTKVTVKLKR